MSETQEAHLGKCTLLHKDAFCYWVSFFKCNLEGGVSVVSSIFKVVVGYLLVFRFSDFWYLFIGKWASKLDKRRSCSSSWPDTWWKWSGGCENNWSLLCMPGRRTGMNFCITLMFLWSFLLYPSAEPRDGRLLLRTQKALLGRLLWLSCCDKPSLCLWERFITIALLFT